MVEIALRPSAPPHPSYMRAVLCFSGLYLSDCTPLCPCAPQAEVRGDVGGKAEMQGSKLGTRPP